MFPRSDVVGSALLGVERPLDSDETSAAVECTAAEDSQTAMVCSLAGVDASRIATGYAASHPHHSLVSIEAALSLVATSISRAISSREVALSQTTTREVVRRLAISPRPPVAGTQTPTSTTMATNATRVESVD